MNITPSLTRTTDAGLVNFYGNHPEIRPFVGGDGASVLDLEIIVDRPEHVWLIGDHGGFGLIWSCPNRYEVHTFIVKAGRGAWARDAAKAMIVFMKSIGAKSLWTKIEPTMKNVISYATQMGMRDAAVSVEMWGKSYGVYEMDLSCH